MSQALGDRIIIENKPELFRLTIKAFNDPSKQSLLFAWMLIWTLCGIYLVSQFFVDHEHEDFKTFLIVWAGFWLYFEYKVVYAFRWRKSGEEVIQIKDNRLAICRQIADRGLFKYYSLDYIKDFRMFNDGNNGFIKSMNDSYWIVSGEKLAFEYQGRTIVFGMQLNEKDASALHRTLKYEIKNRSVEDD